MKYLLLFLSIMTIAAGQLLLKKGVMEAPPEATISSIIKTLFNPYVFAGYVSYLISSILGLFVLKKFPLSVAFPSMSLTYVLIVLVSVYFFKERLTSFKILGLILIMAGVLSLFKD